MNQRKFLTSVALFSSALGLSLVSSIFVYQGIATASPGLERTYLSKQKENELTVQKFTLERTTNQPIIIARKRRRRKGIANQGIASYYGRHNSMTAAHRTLPFGTRVKVTNTLNGRSVVVKINDRGPFIRGRIIDVSRGAARRLGMIHRGIVPVRIQVLGR